MQIRVGLELAEITGKVDLFWNPPSRYICFFKEKRQIHWCRPFFPPLHGLFRKRGGTRAGIRFSFPDVNNKFLRFFENFKELESACPEWQPNTQAVHPKWFEHHQTGHLTKDKNCPVCVEEAGSRVAHWRKKGDRQTGVMQVDLAAFEHSAGGNKCCLVAAVTIEVDKEPKLWPIFVPMPKKDSVSALAALKEV